MDENRDEIREVGQTTTISYSKEFMWEIEHFVDWWASRPVAESSRCDSTTWEEEINVEQPKRWEQASGSPFFTFEINGVNHQFRIDVLKYDSWDRFDDDHNQMMGISLFYGGPWESIPVKPLFFIKEKGNPFPNNTNKVKELMRGGNSYARVFADHSIASNLNEILNPHFKICCTVQVDIVQDDQYKQSLPTHVSKIAHFNPFLHQELNFTVKDGCFQQLSDFEIICVDQKDDKETFETTLHCHKIMLCLGSEYYRKIFSGHFVESNGKVVVTDVSSTTMMKVLLYIYTDYIQDADIDVDVLYAADKYEMEQLKAFSESKLKERLNIDNVFDISMAANNCGSQNFKELVSGFLCKNWKKISQDSRSQIFSNNPAILREILNQM